MGGSKRPKFRLLGMSLTVPALMGVSATMCSMVGGFLLLRHTRINGQIEESRLREIFYRAEQNSIHQSSRENPVPFYQEAVVQLWRNNQRLLALAYMKDAEGDIVSRLSASRGNLRRAVVSWGAMLAIGVVMPAAAVGLFGWKAPGHAVGAAHLVVVGAMLLSIVSVLKPPKEERESAEPLTGEDDAGQGRPDAGDSAAEDPD